MNYLVFVLIALMVICFVGSREGFVDFGFSGYHKPASNFNFSEEVQAINMSDYRRDTTEIPVDKVNGIVQVVKHSLGQRIGRCMEPVETIYINKYSNDKASVYDTRFMFYDPKHFFMNEILATVLQNNGSDDYMIGTIRTQVPSADVSGPLPYTENGGSHFEEYPQLLKDLGPSKSALDAVSKALKQNEQQQ